MPGLPYNVKVASVQGRGRIKHREFHFATGEMTEDQYMAFPEAGCRNIARVCIDGAIVFTSYARAESRRRPPGDMLE